MNLPDVTAAVLLAGLTLYAVFGGADFGAGMWDLLAGSSPRAERVRTRIDSSLGPVWEANHVWLIFALVISWTAFGDAFGAISTTLFVPLGIAALGIVLRGSGFAFRKVTHSITGHRAYSTVFAVSSVLTPFFMGTVVGAIAAEQVPVPADSAGALSSWLNPVSIVVGLLFVVTCAYVAAVFLCSDTRRSGDEELAEYFRVRALASAVVAGALAIAGLFALHADARYVFDGLTDRALPLVLLSGACGAAALVLLARRKTRGLRALALAAVAAVVWGWGVAQHPYLLPQKLKIDQAAPAHETLVLLLAVFAVAALIVVPALGLLYVLHQRSLLDDGEPSPGAGPGPA